MAKLIRNERIESDNWQLLDADIGRWVAVGEDGLVPDFPDQADLVAPLALLRARGADLLERSGRTGALLDAADDPAALAGMLERLALVAVRFPKFSDGRGHSSARLLRERHGFRGELRAVGDVLRDQVLFLKRCGFDAFALREDQDAAEALAALAELGEQYQASCDQPQPLFRRRQAHERTAAGNIQ